MTDKDFTASNGWTVSSPDSIGDINICSSKGVFLDYISSDSIPPLREYFQAERDKELGRWRDPNNPNYVVYPRTGPEDRNILNEKEGVVFYAYDDNVSSKSDWVEYVVLRNYLKAHKPKGCKANTTVLGSRLGCAGDAGHEGKHFFEDADSGAIITWANANVV